MQSRSSKEKPGAAQRQKLALDHCQTSALNSLRIMRVHLRRPRPSFLRYLPSSFRDLVPQECHSSEWPSVDRSPRACSRWNVAQNLRHCPRQPVEAASPPAASARCTAATAEPPHRAGGRSEPKTAGRSCAPLPGMMMWPSRRYAWQRISLPPRCREPIRHRNALRVCRTSMYLLISLSMSFQFSYLSMVNAYLLTAGNLRNKSTPKTD